MRFHHGLLALLGGLLASACSAVGESQDGPVDHFLYVTAESADQVHKVRFDGRSAEVVKVIPVGYQPTEIEGPHGLTVAPDGRYWYLTMAHGKPYGLLYKYDALTDELVDEVGLGLFPATMQISASTELLYCVNFDLHGDMSPSTVSIVDPESMTEVARTTTGPMPHGSRLSPDGLRHYSCSMMNGKLYEIDAVDFEVKRELDLDESHGGHAGEHAGMGGPDAQHGEHHAAMQHAMSKPTWVQPHPFLPLAYVCLSGVGQVAEVDLEQWKVLRRFSTPAGPYNVDVTPDGKKLLVSYKGAQGIGIWDIESGLELARFASGRRVTHGVALSKDGRFGFVSSEGVGAENGTLDVIDLVDDVKVCTIELGVQAGGIAYWGTRPQSLRSH